MAAKVARVHRRNGLVRAMRGEACRACGRKAGRAIHRGIVVSREWQRLKRLNYAAVQVPHAMQASRHRIDHSADVGRAHACSRVPRAW